MKKLILSLLFFPISFFAQDNNGFVEKSSQDIFLERLNNSPRHHEWVEISVGENKIKSFLVYPEVSKKVPIVIIIHENKGLNNWAKSMADQIAEMGYIALAPDFLSGTGSNGGGTIAYGNSNAARDAIYALNPDDITDILNAKVDYAKNISAGNSKVAVVGFCWGGSQSFRFATNNNTIETAIVCYGSGPKDESAYKNIEFPVYGFYGENDNRVNSTIEQSEAAMKAYGKFFEPIIYEGAGHGFFRSGEEQNASKANELGRKKGLKRLKKILDNL